LLDGVCVASDLSIWGMFGFKVEALMLGGRVGMSVSKEWPGLLNSVGNDVGRCIVCSIVDTVVVGNEVGISTSVNITVEKLIG
jgi:hypothetical protein